jgi:glycosyltransferase involved in cell wall biosynthesis
LTKTGPTLTTNMEKQPTVSCILTCYNLEDYLGEAVESVRGQTVQPLETIVIHDGCDKPTMYTGTHTVFREENRGVAESRDEGVRIAKGEWLLFLDADDALAENYIEECLKHTGKADIIYPNVLLWSWWGKEAPKPNAWHPAGKKPDLETMLKHNQWLVVSSLMRRSVYEELGGFDPSLAVFEDWDYWIRAIIKGFTFRRANTYLKYRQRSTSRNHQSDQIRAQVLTQVRACYQGHVKKRS